MLVGSVQPSRHPIEDCHDAVPLRLETCVTHLRADPRQMLRVAPGIRAELRATQMVAHEAGPRERDERIALPGQVAGQLSGSQSIEEPLRRPGIIWSLQRERLRHRRHGGAIAQLTEDLQCRLMRRGSVLDPAEIEQGHAPVGQRPCPLARVPEGLPSLFRLGQEVQRRLRVDTSERVAACLQHLHLDSRVDPRLDPVQQLERGAPASPRVVLGLGQAQQGRRIVVTELERLTHQLGTVSIAANLEQCQPGARQLRGGLVAEATVVGEEARCQGQMPRPANGRRRHCGGTPVEVAPRGMGELLVGDLAEQRITDLVARVPLAQHPGADQAIEGRLCRAGGERLDLAERCAIAEDGHVLKHGLVGGCERVQAGRENRLQGGRKRRTLARCASSSELAVGPEQAYELAHVEGIAVRLRGDRRRGLRWHAILAGELHGQRRCIGRRQGVETKRGGSGEASQPVCRHRPSAEQHCHREVGDSGSELAQGVEVGARGVVHVVDDDEQGMLASSVGHESAQPPDAAVVESCGGSRAVFGRTICGGGKVGTELPAELRGQAAAHQDPVPRAADPHRRPLVGCAGDQLVGEPRLAHPRLAGEEDHLGARALGDPPPT